MTTQTSLLEKKIELETLYNQLLMQHESLPSEIHKEWNQKAMDCIDEGLTKLEKELTIEIGLSDSEVEMVKDESSVNIEVNTELEIVKTELYNKQLVTTEETEDEVIKNIYTLDQYGWETRIARFNFLSGYGHYYTIEGEMVEVKRYSTIINYFLKEVA